jgi:hypothetical protein
MTEEPGEPRLAETIERLTGRIMNGIIIAAAIIGLSIWSRPGPPRYQAVATSDGRVVRVNTSNGSIVSCDAARCALVYRSGRHLDRAPAAPPALPRQPAPAPAPVPATPPAR